MNRLLLENKVAVITGASAGIGFAIAELFTEEGAKVVITGRNRQKLDDAVAELEKKGAVALGVQGDASDPAAPAKTIKAAIDAFGTIDIMVNNAGHGSGHYSFEATTDDDYDAVLDTNLKGTFLFSREFFNAVKEKGKGVIVNVASVNGLRPLTGAAYCASKFGIVGLTKNMALRCTGTGFRVNALCPGTTETPMQEESRKHVAGLDQGSMMEIVYSHSDRTVPCTAMEVAQAALFLACDLSSGCNGTTLVVDKGGYL